MNEYITEGRYPGDLAFQGFCEEDAREAIDAAEQIEAFVLDKIGPLDEAGSDSDNDDG